MIVAGEASGDMYGARLAAAIGQRNPDVSLTGMGAGEMRRAGVEVLFDASKIAVVGLVEVLWHAHHIVAAMKILKQRLAEGNIDLLILIDLPDFNLKLAGFAHRLGIPILYYVSPQIWAWRTGRVHKISRLVNRMAVILPFEEDFYRKFGVSVDFVGHPLADLLPTPAEEEGAGFAAMPSPPFFVGLMPGSRTKEIEFLLPLYYQVARLLLKRLQNIQFNLFLAPGMENHPAFQAIPDELEKFVRIIEADRYRHMRDCHAVIAASGTATLELALLDVPMVVTYRVSTLTSFFAKRLIKIKHVSLVNLVADANIVPELLQEEASPQRIVDETMPLLLDKTLRQRMLVGLRGVRQKLGGPGAAARTAEIALDMIAHPG